MPKEQKLCFVVMGYGEKVDPLTNKKLDLDKTYKNIIKPSVESAGLTCLRGDEVKESGLIDKTMYALLMHADLVVADITTANPNALYELGIRHAVKPFSTIVIKEEESQIPFDLNSTKIFHYRHLGPDIGVEEAQRAVTNLRQLITEVVTNERFDSPLYEYLKDVSQPKISEDELDSVLGELAEKENSVFAITEQAKKFMAKDDFIKAKEKWRLACDLVPNEKYYLQQLTLSTYKSKDPSPATALDDALKIIEPLAEGSGINDPETLGLTGAIYKRKWELSKDMEHLNRAIRFYKKGFEINSDHYTGENYALCLNMKAAIETDERKRIHFEMSAEEVRESILENLKPIADKLRENPSKEYMWHAATIAHCHLALSNTTESEFFERIFLCLNDSNWQKDSYESSKTKLLGIHQRD